MAVLLQFNEQTSLTVQQLGENTGTIQLQSIREKSPCFNARTFFLSIFTGIAQENLLQVLQILLKAKLLTCSDDESSLNGASVIELFLAYKK